MWVHRSPLELLQRHDGKNDPNSNFRFELFYLRGTKNKYSRISRESFLWFENSVVIRNAWGDCLHQFAYAILLAKECHKHRTTAWATTTTATTFRRYTKYTQTKAATRNCSMRSSARLFFICIYATYMSYAGIRRVSHPLSGYPSGSESTRTSTAKQRWMNAERARQIQTCNIESKSNVVVASYVAFAFLSLSVSLALVCARVRRQSSSRHNKNRTMDAYIVQLDLFGRVATNSTALRQAARTLWPKKLNFFFFSFDSFDGK